MTESQKVLSKLERKDKRRAVKGRAGADAELEWLTLNGLDALVEAEVMQRSKAQVMLPRLSKLGMCAFPTEGQEPTAAVAWFHKMDPRLLIRTLACTALCCENPCSTCEAQVKPPVL